MNVIPSEALYSLLSSRSADLSIGLRTASSEELLPWKGSVVEMEGKWSVSTMVTQVPGRGDSFDVVSMIRLEEGTSPVTSIRLSVEFSGWNPASYVFAPCMVYHGNRFEIVDVPYSPFWPDASHYAVDKPISVTNQVHLNKDGSPSIIETDTWGVSTPCLGWRSPEGRGFLLFTPDHNELGAMGLTIAEDGPSAKASFSVESPRRLSLIHI